MATAGGRWGYDADGPQRADGDGNDSGGDRRPSGMMVLVLRAGGAAEWGVFIGTVRWIWRDDSGKSHEYLVKDAFFFRQSPINIISVTCFFTVTEWSEEYWH